MLEGGELKRHCMMILLICHTLTSVTYGSLLFSLSTATAALFLVHGGLSRRLVPEACVCGDLELAKVEAHDGFTRGPYSPYSYQ